MKGSLKGPSPAERRDPALQPWSQRTGAGAQPGKAEHPVHHGCRHRLDAAEIVTAKIVVLGLAGAFASQ
jgi:hypothetical protein